MIKKRFNINNAKKCLAKTRQSKPCQAPAMKNGRCKMHGGKSTGAKTKEGLEKIKKVSLKNGRYTQKAILERKALNSLIKEAERLLFDMFR